MQFLEKGLSGLETAVHKVDALAAKVAVERGVAREAEPDELATDPSAFDTADAIRALATRLGEWTAPSGADGGRESKAHLDATLTELEAAEAASSAAVARRDEAESRLADEIGVRDREESDATDEATGLERELERERAAHAMTRSQAATRARRMTDDSVEYDAMLADATTAIGERMAEAEAAEADAKAARELELGLTREAEEAETAADEAEARAARLEEAEDALDGGSSRHSTDDKTARRLDELRAAVAAAEEEAARLAARERRAREAREASSSSPGGRGKEERERDHARRMADAEAQLARKRAQVSALESEKAELEAKLATVLQRAAGGGGGNFGGRGGGGRGVSAGSSFGGVGFGRGGLKRRGAGGDVNVPGSNPADDTPGRIGFRSRVRVVAGRVDALSAEAGRHLRRSGGWRSAMIVYVLSLHSLAFLILAVRALTAAPGK